MEYVDAYRLASMFSLEFWGLLFQLESRQVPLPIIPLIKSLCCFAFLLMSEQIRVLLTLYDFVQKINKR